jgi:hypothetical protein
MSGRFFFFFRQKATAWAGPQAERAKITIIGMYNFLIIVEYSTYKI